MVTHDHLRPLNLTDATSTMSTTLWSNEVRYKSSKNRSRVNSCGRPPVYYTKITEDLLVNTTISKAKKSYS